jgi:Ca2+-binding RTX toxin-like protein
MGSKQTQTATVNGTSFDVYTYRPDGEINGILLTFHGSSRDAALNRDVAVSIADKMGYYVVAPLFDSARFDESEYQNGGIIKDGKLITDRDDWTVSYAKGFAAWGSAQAGLDSSDDVVLFGHSGGGQFLSRVAGYTAAGDDSGFDRMIIANPSTHVWPSLTEKVPYGFGGYFSATESEALLKDYLADPITIYLGSLDNDPNAPDLSRSAAAMRQGDDRLERGLNAYNAAKAMAESKGWDFNWELVIADGVGHSVGGMARAPAMTDAIDVDEPVLTYMGTTAGDVLAGTIGADVLWGLAGNDTLAGGTGHDVLYAGSGNDTFDFNAVGQSLPGSVCDEIRDWGNVSGNNDTIDLRGIDAKFSTSGDQAFAYRGTSAFTGSSGQVRWYFDGSNTIVEGTINSDTVPDFQIKIAGQVTLTSADFLL